jgi:Protein of unknown function (DUF3795)
MSEELVGACGLLCSECEAFLATQANDGGEIEAIAVKWSTMFGATIRADSVWCDGCMSDGYHKCGHTAECEIRACVVGRELKTCADCTHYACDRLETFLDGTADTGARERLDSMRPIF